jgi:hypothetical protein
MNRQKPIITWCVATMVLAGMAQVAPARGRKAPTPLTAQGQKLQAKYAGMIAGLKKEIVPALPAIDEKKKAAFVGMHALVAKVPSQPNPNGYSNAPPRYAPSHKLYAVAQSNAVLAATPLLSDLDAFLSSDKLDVKLRKLALVAHATPRGLAVFAQQGKEEEALIDELLGDDALIKQIMELGGCHSGKYGQAMRSYKAIQKASKRAKKGFWQRFALASAMEHPGGCVVFGGARKEGMTDVEVNVEVFLDYEKAYLEGKLDEAFGTYSDFNWRFVMHIFSVEDLNWMRTMLRNYRPDHIRNPDYKWRYCRITMTDVPYTSGVDRSGMPTGLSRFQHYLLEGGVCGPRCFTGKLATTAFGIPTRFASQRGHAAMCHWTPDGWTTVFGAHWTFNHHGGICGLDFSLEERARNATKEYMKVNRAEWVGYAIDEAKVPKRTYGVGGDFWNALALYKKLAIVEKAKIAELAPTGEELAESNVETVISKVAQIKFTKADKTIVFGDDGVITIPPAACIRPTNNTDKICFMKTIDGNAMQVHYSLGGGQPELLKYYVNVPKAGKYAFTARVCNVTLGRSMLLRLNRRTLLDVALPYTKGFWKDTSPLTIDLKKGRNTLLFTIKAPNKGVSIKHFKLKPQNARKGQ